MTASDDRIRTEGRPRERQRIARVILAPGGNVKTLRVQEVNELGVKTDYVAEGCRFAEFLYWGAPWRYFNGLRDRLNELQPPDNDRYGRPATRQVKGRRTEVEQRAYRFLSTRWMACTTLIMACNILPETLDSLVRKGWAVVSSGGGLTRYKKARR